MQFRELWRLSNKVSKELSFQAIYSLRLGSSLPRRGSTDIRRLVRNAQFNTLISKILTTLFICAFGFTVFLPLTYSHDPSDQSRQLTFAGGLSAFLASVLFLIVFMGLQVATSMVSARIADTLSPLPLTKKDISNIMFICFVRIFDIPLVAAVVVLLSAYLLIGGTLLGSLVCLASVIATDAFAVALTTGLAKFFYSRVASGEGRSMWKTFLRLAFMLVWILPTFGMYLVINFARNIVEIFGSLAQGLSTYTQLLVLVYPFSFGFFASFATYPQETDYLVLSISAVASLAYVLLAVYSLKWVVNAMRRMGMRGAGATKREEVKDTIIKPQPRWLGIIRKDLRVASRSPAYASLFLLPAMQTAILAVSFSSIDVSGFGAAIGLLTGVSLMTLLLPPTMFSIEGLASAYTRSLPLEKRTLILAKTALSVLTYIVSLAALFLVALYLGKDFTNILTYASIHALSITAASMMELVILANKFWKEGFALGNVYARLSTFILIILPGLFITLIPIAAAFLTYFMAPAMVLPVFLGVALVEFAVLVFIVTSQK